LSGADLRREREDGGQRELDSFYYTDKNMNMHIILPAMTVAEAQ
jgi:hypothetical protein